MSCQIIMMDVDGNHAFEVDEVVAVLPVGVDIGKKIRGNPKFKIVNSDMLIEEAQTLLEHEYDIFMNIVKQRTKLVYVRDIFEKEIEMQRDEVVERVVVKDPETFEQTEDVVVG